VGYQITTRLAIGIDHRIPGLAAERRGIRRHVGGRAIGADAARRVRIRGQLHLQRLGSDLVAPHRREAQEEALVARQPVDLRIGHILGGALQSVVGDVDAAQVGDVLAQRQLAVHLAAPAACSRRTARPARR
jgi:hypothetical protein